MYFLNNSVIQNQFNYQKMIFLKIFFLMQIHKAFRTVQSEGMGNSSKKKFGKNQ